MQNSSNFQFLAIDTINLNAACAHVYLQPTAESAYTLLDDLTETLLACLDAR